MTINSNDTIVRQEDGILEGLSRFRNERLASVNNFLAEIRRIVGQGGRLNDQQITKLKSIRNPIEVNRFIIGCQQIPMNTEVSDILIRDFVKSANPQTSRKMIRTLYDAHIDLNQLLCLADAFSEAMDALSDLPGNLGYDQLINFDAHIFFDDRDHIGNGEMVATTKDQKFVCLCKLHDLNVDSAGTFFENYAFFLSAIWDQFIAYEYFFGNLRMLDDFDYPLNSSGNIGKHLNGMYEHFLDTIWGFDPINDVKEFSLLFKLNFLNSQYLNNLFSQLCVFIEGENERPVNDRIYAPLLTEIRNRINSGDLQAPTDQRVKEQLQTHMDSLPQQQNRNVRARIEYLHS